MTARILCLLIPLTTLTASHLSVLGAQSVEGWKAHDMERPRRAAVQPGALSLPAPAPSDAIVLFDGGDLSEWRSRDGGPPTWRLGDGYMETDEGLGDIQTRRAFGDVQLHLEWMAPTPARGEGQGRGNSGVFLMGLYEVQILDSYENDTYPDGQAAAVYGQQPPLSNASLPPGEWQSYDIIFRRPRFSIHGELLQPARVTVIHNGVVVQDAAEFLGPTGWLQHPPYRLHADRLPLILQEHGDPVRFRNIWVRELPAPDRLGPSEPYPTTDYVADLRQLAPLAGTYRSERGALHSVRLEGAQLQVRFYGGAWIDLIPWSRERFQLRHTAAEIHFDLDETGEPAGFRFHIGGEARWMERVDGP